MAEAEDVDALMSRMDQLQTDIDAVDGWEIDRQLDRAMDALRCPPGVRPLLRGNLSAMYHLVSGHQRLDRC